MEKIKLDLKNKTVAEKIDTGKTISKEMKLDGDVDVQNAGTSLDTESTELRTKKSDSVQKKADSKEATRLLKEEAKHWEDVMRSAAAKVMEKYPNNPSKWLGFGFELTSTNQVGHLPEKILNLSATYSDFERQMDLHWDGLGQGVTYKIQMTEDDPEVEANWKPAKPDTSTSSQATATDLTSGKRTFFRVAGFNASGQGPWSDYVGRIVP